MRSWGPLPLVRHFLLGLSADARTSHIYGRTLGVGLARRGVAWLGERDSREGSESVTKVSVGGTQANGKPSAD